MYGHFIADSSFVPPLVYAFMGSSRDIAIGPVAVVSLLLGTLLQGEIDPSNVEYRHLAFTATFFAGITQATLGFLRYLDCFLLHVLKMIFPAPMYLCFQIRFPGRLSFSCCNCWVYGWSCHNYSSSAAQRSIRHQKLHEEDRHCVCNALSL